MTENIRFVALGAVRRKDELLVVEGESPETGELFYRLLGGEVEFGEHSREAVVREFDEELDVTFEISEHIGTFEDVFTHEGEKSHEVWRVYEGRIEEDWPYERESITFVEPETGTEHVARWIQLDRLVQDETTFYIPAILDALES